MLFHRWRRPLTTLFCGCLSIALNAPASAQIGTPDPAEADPLGLPPRIPAVTEGATTVDLTTVQSGWTYPAGPSTQPARPLRLPIKLMDDAAGRKKTYLSGIAFTGAPAQQMFATYYAGPGGKSEAALVRTDLRTGANTQPYPVVSYSAVASATPDGSAVLMHYPNSPGRSRRIDVWKVPPGPGRLQHVAGFEPPDFGTRAAVVMSGQGVVTIAFHDLVLWKLPEAKAQWTMKVAHAALSPDGRFVAAWAPKSDGLYIIDTETGKALAKLDDGPLGGRLAWHPDGTRLLTASPERIAAWDLTVSPARKLWDFALPPDQAGPSNVLYEAHWAGKNHILLRRRLLVEPELGVVAWEYIHPDASDPALAGQPDDRLWLTSTRRGGAVIAATVPDQPAQQKIAELKRTPAPLLAAPGMAVALNLSLPGDATEAFKADAREQLKKHIADAGYTLAEGEAAAKAPLRLSVAITSGPSETVEYVSGPGGSGAKHTASVPSFILDASLTTAEGTQVWSRQLKQSGSAADRIHLLEGRSLQDEINRDSRRIYEGMLRYISGLPRQIRSGPPSPYTVDPKAVGLWPLGIGAGASQITPTGAVVPWQPKE